MTGLSPLGGTSLAQTGDGKQGKTSKIKRMPGRPRADTEDGDSSTRGDSMQPEDGDGKGSSSTQVRKAQNRIAQREFRLRKQQYVRDLEARVEVLSGDKEERVELMTLLVRNLLKENKELRTMVQSMAAFLGEGMGSCLPRLGLSAVQLDAILNRADTDTAYEAFVNLKASREMETANPGLKMGEPRRRSSSTFKRKRGNSPDDNGRQEGPSSSGPSAGGSSSTQGAGAIGQKSNNERTPISEEFTYLFPDLDGMMIVSDAYGAHNAPRSGPVAQQGESSSASGGPPPLPPPRMESQEGHRHGYAQQLMHDTAKGPQPYPNQQYNAQPATYPNSDLSGFGITIPASSAVEDPMSSLAGPSSASSQTQAGYAQKHAHILTTDVGLADDERQKQLTAAVHSITHNDNTSFDGPGMTAAELAERRRQQDQLMKTIEQGDRSDRKMEAMQLITYHLNNFRVNHEYHLPPSLRPTVIQRTVPHEHAIDGIVFPTIRDRMILLRGRYDLVEVFHAILSEFTLHGQDVLDHRSYEVSEKFIHNYSILIDEQVIEISDKWRAARGEPPLQRPDKSGPGERIVPAERVKG
ncbi:hypothetical protein CI109_101040 [Kwoniella shandongensis]|uniref:BZIP domain-containing protein n=1 Tax=Kwoniella shandongensis TaxID=1734106 RepID=A0AAJ8LF47_9TREE